MPTTNYQFEVPTGSALVNPLTIDAPNWNKLDTVLKGVQDDSIQSATELVSGKVHAITCLEDGSRYMHFTATGDFRSGDTFTFNGAPVAAYLPDGSGLSDYAYRVNSEVLISVVGSRLTVYTYAPNAIAEDSLNLGGNPPEYYGKATDTISVYVQSKIGTTHNFVGNGTNGKVKFVSNVQEGDTIQLNGQPVTAFCGVEDFIETFKSKNIVGKTFFFAVDGSVITFSGGGTSGGGDKYVFFDQVTETGSSNEPAQEWTAIISEKCVCSIAASISVARGSYGSLDAVIFKNGNKVMEGSSRTDTAVHGGSFLTLPLIAEFNPGDSIRVWIHGSHYAKTTMTLNVLSDKPITFERR